MAHAINILFYFVTAWFVGDALCRASSGIAEHTHSTAGHANITLVRLLVLRRAHLLPSGVEGGNNNLPFSRALDHTRPIRSRRPVKVTVKLKTSTSRKKMSYGRQWQRIKCRIKKGLNIKRK